MTSTLIALAIVAPSVRLEARFEPLPNMLYQLDIVSGALPYTKSRLYSELWEMRMIKSAADRKAIDEWRDEMRRLDSIQVGKWDPEFFFSTSSLSSQGEKIRFIGLTANNLDEFARRAASEVGPASSKKLVDLARRFQARFDSWWEEEALPAAGTFPDQTQELLVSPKIQATIARLVQFYRPDLPQNFVVPVQLMIKPKGGEPTNGEQVGSAAVMQFFPGDKPANRVDVTLHELAHFLYRSAPIDLHRATLKRFLSLQDRSRLAIYSIMNEALATALCNGMVPESLMKPEAFQRYRDAKLSWYFNESIDQVAKSSYDWLKKYVEKGGSLHDKTFARDYVASLRVNLGSKVDAPGVQFFGVNYVWSKAWPDSVANIPREIFQTTVSNGFSDSKIEDAIRESKKSANLASLLILKPGEIDRAVRAEPLLRKLAADLNSQVVKDGRAIAGTRRANGTAVYCLVANSDEDVRELLVRLSQHYGDLDGILEQP